MAAQALCEPVPKDATKVFDFKSGLLSAVTGQGVLKHQESVPVIIWPDLTFSDMEYLGSRH
jgi:hypothetical protein